MLNRKRPKNDWVFQGILQSLSIKRNFHTFQKAEIEQMFRPLLIGLSRLNVVPN